jgi:hypothetical protein
MTVLIDDFYRSSNGDRWQLHRDTASWRRVASCGTSPILPQAVRSRKPA